MGRYVPSYASGCHSVKTAYVAVTEEKAIEQARKDGRYAASELDWALACDWDTDESRAWYQRRAGLHIETYRTPSKFRKYGREYPDFANAVHEACKAAFVEGWNLYVADPQEEEDEDYVPTVETFENYGWKKLGPFEA